MAPTDNDRPKLIYVPNPVVIREHVEQTGIEDRVERAIQRDEVERIMDYEPGIQPSIVGLLVGALDRRRCQVDSSRLVTKGRRQKRVLAGAATHVEYAADETTRSGKLREGRLRSPDIPGRLARVAAVKIGLASRPHGRAKSLALGCRPLF